MISLIFGICAVLFGIKILVNPIHIRPIYGTVINFTEYQPLLGLLFILFGFMFIVVSLKSIKANSNKSNKICPACGEVFPKFVSRQTCTKCGETLEELKGFYERHPEKKE